MSDDYRTEPAFKLQGSYRDMNKMAESVASIMNDAELDALVRSHYENQAQTLTADAEANLLKLCELRGTLADQSAVRWEEIKTTFQRNTMLGAAGDDKFAQIVGQLMDFRSGLDEIRSVLARHLDQRQLHDDFAQLNHGLGGLQHTIETCTSELRSTKQNPQKVEFVYRVPKVLLDVIRGQFAIMQGWIDPITELTRQSRKDAQEIRLSMGKRIGEL